MNGCPARVLPFTRNKSCVAKMNDSECRLTETAR